MAMLLALAIIYYFIDPSQARFMPQCPSKFLTGFDCPGCGAQRAAHAVLHGDFIGAIHYNAFLLIGIPYLLLALWGSCSSLPGSGKASRLAHSPYLVFGYVCLFFIWWIVRNL